MSEILITGSGENLYTFAKILALPKGNNNLFPYRKLAVKGESIYARQLSSDNIIYSQVVVTPIKSKDSNGQDVIDESVNFLTVKGEGDVMLDMAKTLSNLGILRTFKQPYIKHNTETQETTYAGIDDTGHSIEWTVSEPKVDINDGANGNNPILYVPCKCGGSPDCKVCGGSGGVPAPALSFTNDTKPVYYNVAGSAYNPEDIRLEIDTAVLKSIGDRTEKLFDQFPMTFGQSNLVISIGNPEDIGQDKFKEVIPVQYVKNTVPNYRVVVGEYYKNIFSNLTGKVNLFTKQQTPEEAGVYTTMNRPGLHTGILIGGVKEPQ